MKTRVQILNTHTEARCGGPVCDPSTEIRETHRLASGAELRQFMRGEKTQARDKVEIARGQYPVSISCLHINTNKQTLLWMLILHFKFSAKPEFQYVKYSGFEASVAG